MLISYFYIQQQYHSNFTTHFIVKFYLAGVLFVLFFIIFLRPGRKNGLFCVDKLFVAMQGWSTIEVKLLVCKEIINIASHSKISPQLLNLNHHKLI